MVDDDATCVPLEVLPVVGELDDITELGGEPSQDTDLDGLHDIFDPDSDAVCATN